MLASKTLLLRLLRASTVLTLLTGGTIQIAFADSLKVGTTTLGALAAQAPEIIHVTNLNDSGKGSLREAIRTKGARVIIFDVGGAIELKSDIRITNPDVTVAGQTAPSPGITLHGRSLKIRASNVVVQHIAVRPWNGERPEKGDERDAITIFSCDDCEEGASDILLENVSTTWGVDENIGFWGKKLERVTVRNSLIAEGLRNAGHPKGVHSMGSLIGGNVSAAEITGNFFASNLRRNPVVGGGASAYVANNFIYNPGRNSVHVYQGANTRVSIIGNVTLKGPDTDERMTPFQIQGDLSTDSPGAEIYAADNHCCDGRAGSGDWRPDDPLAAEPVTVSASWRVIPAADVWSHVSRYAGSRPAERGATDARIVSGAERGDGRVIDSPQEVGGDPIAPGTEKAPAMPDRPLELAGGSGMTRLAAWLCLRHFEVGGPQTPQCTGSADELRSLLD